MTIPEIQEAVCAQWPIKLEDMIGPRRNAGVVFPRMAAMRICVEVFNHPKASVDRAFNRKNGAAYHASRHAKPIPPTDKEKENKVRAFCLKCKDAL